MHKESLMVAGALFVLGLVFLTKYPKIGYVFFGLGGLMVWAGAAT